MKNFFWDQADQGFLTKSVILNTLNHSFTGISRFAFIMDIAKKRLVNPDQNFSVTNEGESNLHEFKTNVLDRNVRYR